MTTEDDSKSLFPAALLFWRNSNQISISVQAVKGIIRNGIVQVAPINNLGICDKGNILATENTNSVGVFTISDTPKQVDLVITQKTVLNFLKAKRILHAKVSIY